MVRQAVKLNGIDGIALTKLDVLDGLEEIKVCVGYELDGKRIERFPFTMGAQAKLKPIWETFEGWSESTQGARSFARAAGDLHQIRAPRRGADRLPGGAAQHQPRARGHDPDDGSVQGLGRKRRQWPLFRVFNTSVMTDTSKMSLTSTCCGMSFSSNRNAARKASLRCNDEPLTSE